MGACRRLLRAAARAGVEFSQSCLFEQDLRYAMKRLKEQVPLQRGSHPSREDGMCAMEMVSWLAGEAHSDEPRCTCPVLAALVRACNDAMGDAARNLHLQPLVLL